MRVKSQTLTNGLKALRAENNLNKKTKDRQIKCGLFFYFKGLILKAKGTPEGIPLSTGFRARGFRQFFDILGIIIFLRFLDFW